jgi:endonuclease/exonuclease/phosphatase family metal-dependent hydrolase
MASWVQLRDKPSSQEFIVLNTHWDHISDPARRKSAALIRERLSKLSKKLPTIVMGDLNAPEDSAATTTLIGKPGSAEMVFVDSYRKLHPKRSQEESTFNSWAGTTNGSRIDYILHSDDFTPLAADILRTNYDGLWPSDHYPVTAKLRLGK